MTRSQMAFILGVIGRVVMIPSPSVLNTSPNAAVKSGSRSRTREAIALAVGAVDACSYCQAAHTISGKNAGLSEEQMVALRRGTAEFDPKLAALVAVVREIAGGVGEVSDATWQRAVAAGWDDGQLTEAFAHVAANLFTNYFNHYARTDLDLPAAPSLDG